MRSIRIIACITLGVLLIYSLNAICRAPAVSAALGAPAEQTESPAQATAQSGVPEPSQSAAAPMAMLRAGSNLVLVDVVVTDHDRAVHGLDRSHFHVFDNGREQTIASFDEHLPPPAVAAAPVPEKLPPHVYSNIPLFPQTGTLNVLLLDSLNTPTMVANVDVRRQMLEYVSHIPPGTPLAIFTLGSRLQLVQGFTTDTSLLTKVLASPKAGAEKSPINNADADKSEDDQLGNIVGVHETLDIGDDITTSVLLRWMTEDTTNQTDETVKLTLEAMQQLAGYLSAIPGRKNVIWFSGGFPIELSPANNDPNNLIFNPAATTRAYSDEVRQTDELLGSARVAIYPVEAQGLMNLPTFDADYTPKTNLVPGGGGGGSPESSQVHSRSSHPTLVNRPNMAMDSLKAMATTVDQHASMYQIAADTGGHAYLNTNGLQEAVTDILENGSSYYTIGFVPDAKMLDGKFHSIKVKSDDGHDELSYREGYYADQPEKGSAHNVGAPNPITAAMEWGAPAATQILFHARVLPASDPLLQNVKLPEGPGGDKASKFKGPVLRVVVDVAVDPHDLTFTPTPGGGYHDEISYSIFAYDDKGQPVNEVHQAFGPNLTAEQYARMMAPDGGNHIAPHRMAIDLPAGQMALRIIVYELPTMRIGSLEVPATVAAR